MSAAETEEEKLVSRIYKENRERKADMEKKLYGDGKNKVYIDRWKEEDRVGSTTTSARFVEFKRVWTSSIRTRKCSVSRWPSTSMIKEYIDSFSFEGVELLLASGISVPDHSKQIF